MRNPGFDPERFLALMALERALETGRPAPPRAPAEAETPEAVWTVRRAPEEERAVDEETAPVTETVAPEREMETSGPEMPRAEREAPEELELPAEEPEKEPEDLVPELWRVTAPEAEAALPSPVEEETGPLRGETEETFGEMDTIYRVEDLSETPAGREAVPETAGPEEWPVRAETGPWDIVLERRRAETPDREDPAEPENGGGTEPGDGRRWELWWERESRRYDGGFPLF